MPELDAVIVGGGLSGLSLAAHLAANGWGDRSVLIVDDPRLRPCAVSWGFWSAEPGLLGAAAGRTYEQVRVHTMGTSRLLSLGRYRYRVVQRPDLYAVVHAILDRAPGFRFLGGHAERVYDDGDQACVTVGNRTIRCDWAFDSVTAPPPDLPSDARLAFAGWEIQCARPVFDPATPVLFDFRTPQADGSRFVYILPEDAHRALVELTAFVPRRARPPSLVERRNALAEYLTSVLHCGDYHITRAESAVLPLRTHPARRATSRVLAIGASAGLVKASTGYAYQRIQKDSAAIAESLVQYGHPFSIRQTRRRYQFLDAVLLNVFDRDPPQLELAFAQLFEANPADRVLRFLDEDSSPMDVLRLMASLPTAPYLRALAHLHNGQ